VIIIIVIVIIIVIGRPLKLTGEIYRGIKRVLGDGLALRLSLGDGE
jgi:Sec-independent protein translocase protein TatA